MSTTIHKIKNPSVVPLAVRTSIRQEYPISKGFSHEFYKYASGENTIWGCCVMFEGSIWSLPQGKEEDFR